MCRWFAYISPTEPCLLSDVLITPDNSISKQCSEHYLPKLLPHNEEKDLDDSPDELMRMRNSLLNMDGLGIACTYYNTFLDHRTCSLLYGGTAPMCTAVTLTPFKGRTGHLCPRSTNFP